LPGTFCSTQCSQNKSFIQGKQRLSKHDTHLPEAKLKTQGCKIFLRIFKNSKQYKKKEKKEKEKKAHLILKENHEIDTYVIK